MLVVIWDNFHAVLIFLYPKWTKIKKKKKGPKFFTDPGNLMSTQKPQRLTQL